MAQLYQCIFTKRIIRCHDTVVIAITALYIVVNRTLSTKSTFQLVTF